MMFARGMRESIVGAGLRARVAAKQQSSLGAARQRGHGGPLNRLQFMRAPQVLALCCLLFLLSGCKPSPSIPLFDVPALMGKTIDEATQKLGPPKREENGPDGQPRRIWIKNDVTLWANWKAQSGRVTRWGFEARGDSNALSEENRVDLLTIIQATENDPRYSVQWTESTQRPLFYTGAVIVPAPQTHTVKFRVHGAESMLAIRMQPAPPEIPDGFTLTIPPWEATLQAPDDAKLSLSASLRERTARTGDYQMTVEIEVDGKVVQNQTSANLTTSAEYEI